MVTVRFIADFLPFHKFENIKDLWQLKKAVKKKMKNFFKFKWEHYEFEINGNGEMVDGDNNTIKFTEPLNLVVCRAKLIKCDI